MPRRAPWPTSYIPELQARGLSANAALLYLREQGLGIRRQTFLRAWGETRAAIEKRENVQAARLDRRPTASEITPLTTRSKTGYLYHFHALVQLGATGEVYRTPISTTFDRLVSYDRARTEVMDTLLAAQVEGGTLEQERIIDAIPMEVRDMIPAVSDEEFAL